MNEEMLCTMRVALTVPWGMHMPLRSLGRGRLTPAHQKTLTLYALHTNTRAFYVLHTSGERMC